MARTDSADPVVAFYSGQPDDRGRTLDAVLDWPDAQLERVHDYIQWVFPTRQPSGVNPRAPLVTETTLEAFRARPELRARLRAALDRMLVFYGLRRVEAAPGMRIELDGARFTERAGVWLHPGHHNHLRLTRIMQSLATLGLEDEALALQRCLTRDLSAGPGKGRVTRETLEHWTSAVRT